MSNQMTPWIDIEMPGPMNILFLYSTNIDS